MKGEGRDEGCFGWSVAARQVGGRRRSGGSVGVKGRARRRYGGRGSIGGALENGEWFGGDGLGDTTARRLAVPYKRYEV